MRLREIEDEKKASSQDVASFFSTCLGTDLNKDVVLSSTGNEQFHGVLKDTKENILAYIFKAGDEYGACNIEGNFYAPFKYQSIQRLGRMYDGTIPEIFKFVINSDTMDVYSGTELLFKEVNDCFLIYDSENDEAYCRFLNIVDDNHTFIYDLKQKKFLVSLPEYGYSFEEIHGTFEKIIYEKTDIHGGYTSYVVDFSGNELGYITNQKIFFTETNGFYITSCSGKYGLIYENGAKSFETIFDNTISSFYKILSDKAVIKRNGCMEIVSYDTKGANLNIKTVCIGKYDWTEVEIFENEDDAIICLSNSTKILLSHYLNDAGNSAYYCVEIIYKGNGIFKCFHDEFQSQTDVTYICSGQAVNYSEQDEKIHVIHKENDKCYRFLRDNGNIYFENNNVYFSLLSMIQESHYKHNYMTIEPDGMDNVFLIVSSNKSKVKRDYVIDGVTGEKHEILNNEADMIWHDLYSVDNELYVMSNTLSSPCTQLADVLAIFNDHIVINKNDMIYVYSRGFDERLSMKCDYFIDEIYQRFVMINKATLYAYAVSNDGIEIFSHLGKFNNEDVFEAKSDNFIIGKNFVTRKSLVHDLDFDLIDEGYDALL